MVCIAGIASLSNPLPVFPPRDLPWELHSCLPLFASALSLSPYITKRIQVPSQEKGLGLTETPSLWLSLFLAKVCSRVSFFLLSSRAESHLSGILFLGQDRACPIVVKAHSRFCLIMNLRPDQNSWEGQKNVVRQ